MSKVEIIIKADDLATAITKLALALEANHSTPEQIIDEPPTDALAQEPITLEKVRAVLAEKSQAGKQPEVKALIEKFGAKKLTAVDPACYEDLLKEAEVL
ncbi:MAG: hypothetical protein ACM3PE_05355 [Deltaproteobacteria bacterium]